MVRNTRFQRFKEWVCNKIQHLGGRLVDVWRCIVRFCRRGLIFLTRLSKDMWSYVRKAKDQIRRRTSLRVGIIVLIIFALFIWSLWKLPEYQAAMVRLDEKGLTITDTDRKSLELKRLELIDKARGTLAQIWGGLGIAVGLYFTWRRIAAAERTVQVSEEGQITERFTRAIDQLGATDENGQKRLELRLGGIYALERIARDSEKDHWPIIEVLTAYVREHAPWQENSPPQQDQSQASKASSSEEDLSQQQDSQLPWRPSTDIQGILTVLGRRTRGYGKGEEQGLDLHGTDMRGADLRYAHLERAILSNAHLERADFAGAHLERAMLSNAHLEEAYFTEAHLEGAMLSNAHLERADFAGAHLEGAYLTLAHLEGADLRYAHLEGAVLFYAHLEGADLSYAHLEGAVLTSKQLESASNIKGACLPDDLTSSQAIGKENV